MSPGPQPSDVTFFESAAAFRRWLTRHHDRRDEVWVGFHKKAAGAKGLTYPEAIDQALCFGWIDGIRHSIDAGSYTSRFTPRRRGSVWSLVNIRRVGELTSLGLMRPAGTRAFERRDEAESRRYSYESRPASLDAAYEKEFRSHRRAWAFFESQPAGYRRTATFWVMQAKRDETRRRRLATLIEVSAAGRRLPQLTRP